MQVELRRRSQHHLHSISIEAENVTDEKRHGSGDAGSIHPDYFIRSSYSGLELLFCRLAEAIAGKLNRSVVVVNGREPVPVFLEEGQKEAEMMQDAFMGFEFW